ncbi:hypothetical protein [Chryseobacterium sp. PMSZPI]|uniref:hypothetical protein n=1 Tax=Chryseobacterium sp. PMSZPI TaxID=1033900 RepID=UPI00105624D5|nr:hypothetical protein [Chryseobacterium sp. PMSZPI]
MKNIFKFLSVLIVFGLTVIACRYDDEPKYGGDSLLEFDKTEQTAIVVLNTKSVDYLVTYGVVKPVDQDNNVELVFDASKSTAVLGTDFTIVKGTDVLKSGTALGNFKINVKEAGAEAGKTAVFTLKSNSLHNATFNQQVVVTFKLSCPLTNFPLKYDVNVIAFGDNAPSHQQTLTPVAGTTNQFRVNSSWGPMFVAWATGNSSYNNQYLHPGVITITCKTVTFKSDVTYGKGGTGTYDPNTGVIDMVVGQSLFTDPFTARCIFTPH